MLPHRLAEPLRGRWRAELVRRAVPAPALDDLRPCLVLSPHPDDEVLGAGSTILRRTLRGTPVTVVHVSLGERSHAAVAPGRLAVVRRDEALQAAGLLGVQDVRFLGLPDGGIGQQHEQLAEAVARLLRELEPADVLAPAVEEAHPDHAAVARAVRQAVGEPRGGRTPLRLLDYFVWYWSRWPWQQPGAGAVGRAAAVRRELGKSMIVVDGEPVLERKLAALAAYRSQTLPAGGREALPPAVLARAADRHELLGVASVDVRVGSRLPRQ